VVEHAGERQKGRARKNKQKAVIEGLKLPHAKQESQESGAKKEESVSDSSEYF